MAVRRLIYVIFWLKLFIITSQGYPRDFLYLLDLVEEDKVAWVDAHNYYRRKVSNPAAANMRLMSWDDDLATFAERVVKTCSFFHTSVNDRKTKRFNPVGENLYTGGDYRFTDIFSRQGATKLWYDEIQYHDINTLTCQSGKECGHYKQVIWATTYKVGCAIAKCRAIEGGHSPYLVSCNYGPIGNAYLNGRPLHPYQIGTPCSQCDDGDICVDKLCNKTGAIKPAATTPMPSTRMPTSPMLTTNFSTTMMTTPSSLSTSSPVPTTEWFQTTTAPVPVVTTNFQTTSKTLTGTTSGCSGKMCPTMSTSVTSTFIDNGTASTSHFNATVTMTAADAVRTTNMPAFIVILQVASIAWLMMAN